MRLECQVDDAIVPVVRDAKLRAQSRRVACKDELCLLRFRFAADIAIGEIHNDTLVWIVGVKQLPSRQW